MNNFDFEKCPYCDSDNVYRIECSNACGTYWYYECFDCGWCSEEMFSKGYYFGDPDAEYDDQ